MDTLHTVLRNIRGETKSGHTPRPDHLTVFRQFLDQLERLDKRGGVRGAPRPTPQFTKRSARKG